MSSKDLRTLSLVRRTIVQGLGCCQCSPFPGGSPGLVHPVSHSPTCSLPSGTPSSGDKLEKQISLKFKGLPVREKCEASEQLNFLVVRTSGNCLWLPFKSLFFLLKKKKWKGRKKKSTGSEGSKCNSQLWHLLITSSCASYLTFQNLICFLCKIEVIPSISQAYYSRHLLCSQGLFIPPPFWGVLLGNNVKRTEKWV